MTEKDIQNIKDYLECVNRGLQQFHGRDGYPSNDKIQYGINATILYAILDINKRLETLEANNLREGE